METIKMDSSNIQKLEAQLEEIVRGSNADKDYNATKALISFIPAVGSGLVSFYESNVSAPATKRLNEFLKTLVLALAEIQDKLDGLAFHDPAFQTTLMYTLQIASRNHQEEKLEALRNIVLNAALPNAPEEEIQQMFLNWIENFTTLHLNLLKLLHQPDRKTNIDFILPDWENKANLYQVIFDDLKSKGLVTTENQALKFLRQRAQQRRLESSIKSGKVKSVNFLDDLPNKSEDIKTLILQIKRVGGSSRTTKLGKAFIQFLISPIEPQATDRGTASGH
ncbi:hypothetical protein QUB37_17810 [Microcoleus sp. AT3-A2]|uniref:hypothetical protein n=1 Tax=unclassified Microcoleus TaxID=2642155 RepID=UPI002FD3922B